MTLTSRVKLILLLSLASVIFSVGISAAEAPTEKHPEGQVEDPWVKEVPCRDQETEQIGYIGDKEFRLCFTFTASELQPKTTGGANWTIVQFESYTKRANANLTDIDLKVDHPEDHPGLITQAVEAIGPEHNHGNLCSVRKFSTKIGILSEAISNKYPLSLSITSGNATGGRKVEFQLPLLAPNKRSLVVEKISRNELDCWAGSKCSELLFHFENSIPYKLTLKDVSLISDDLLELEQIPGNANSLEANSGRDVTFALKAKQINFMRTFSGFGKPQLTLKLEYKDEYDRVVHSEVEMGFQIRPNILVLAIFLVLGAVVGTLVRIDLGKLQKAGVITKKEKLIFAGTTFASGILVCLIALFANIKLIVLNDQNSYSAWDPKVLFFTALIATVSGLPILYAEKKLPRPPEGGPKNQTPNAKEAGAQQQQ